MIENYRSGMIWDLTCRCGPVVAGLRAAGFEGGWLEQDASKRALARSARSKPAR